MHQLCLKSANYWKSAAGLLMKLYKKLQEPEITIFRTQHLTATNVSMRRRFKQLPCQMGLFYILTDLWPKRTTTGPCACSQRWMNNCQAFACMKRNVLSSTVTRTTNIDRICLFSFAGSQLSAAQRAANSATSSVRVTVDRM